MTAHQLGNVERDTGVSEASDLVTGPISSNLKSSTVAEWRHENRSMRNSYGHKLNMLRRMYVDVVSRMVVRGV